MSAYLGHHPSTVACPGLTGALLEMPDLVVAVIEAAPLVCRADGAGAWGVTVRRAIPQYGQGQGTLTVDWHNRPLVVRLEGGSLERGSLERARPGLRSLERPCRIESLTIATEPGPCDETRPLVYVKMTLSGTGPWAEGAT